MKEVKKIVLAALFLAFGLVLPFLTMQIPEIGNMLLPMHIPVLICGFVCGWKYGLAVGFIVPLLRSVIFGRPFLVPDAVGMAFELATYGLVAGLIYALVKGRRFDLYITLIGAMIAGRVVWGIASIVIYSLLGSSFTWQIFAAGAFLRAIPGIVLQLVIIPPIIAALNKSGLLEK